MADNHFIPPNELTDVELERIAKAAFTPSPDPYLPQGGAFGLSVLCGLGAPRSGGRINRTRHVYGGTVPTATVAKRRVQNKTARKSRRVNRLRGA